MMIGQQVGRLRSHQRYFQGAALTLAEKKKTIFWENLQNAFWKSGKQKALGMVYWINSNLCLALLFFMRLSVRNLLIQFVAVRRGGNAGKMWSIATSIFLHGIRNTFCSWKLAGVRIDSSRQVAIPKSHHLCVLVNCIPQSDSEKYSRCLLLDFARQTCQNQPISCVLASFIFWNDI